VADWLALVDGDGEEADASAFAVQPARASAIRAAAAARYVEAGGRVGRGSGDTVLSHSASGPLR